MEIEVFGFEFGKGRKTKEERQENALQKISAPETFDGTVTVDVGGFFSSAIDYTGTLKDESSAIIQYRNMSVYPEVDNAVEEIVNAAIVKGTDSRPVKLDLKSLQITEPIKLKIYKNLCLCFIILFLHDF